MSLVEAEGIGVQFGGIQALNGVSVTLEEGKLSGLIGPNGAGKSTFLGVLSGLVPPTRGSVHFDGHNITRSAPHKRAALGMARTFQRLELWGTMTVRENIRTAAEFSMRWKRHIDPAAIAEDLLDRLALRPVADTPASALPSGIARVTEVARALAASPRVLLLDEPSAGLDDFESRELTDTLMSVASEGTAVLLVEHHMEMVMRACSEIWVLDFGRLIAHGPAAEMQESEAVQSAYLGTKHVTSSRAV